MPRHTPPEPTGKNFEEEVADVYRSLGYQVTANIQLPGKQTDLIARQEFRGAPPIVLAIECKDHASPVSNDEALGFITRIAAHREGRYVTAGVLVSSHGITKDGRAAAADIPYVTLLSWDELLAEALDVRHQLRELVLAYESSPIYRDYMRLDIETLSWRGLESSQSTTMLEEIVKRWRLAGARSARTSSSLFVLADFGAGKTTLLRRLEYECAKSHIAGIDSHIPLFVPLRDFTDSRSVTTLLRSSFRDSYYRDLPDALIWRHVQNGSFHLLLDGFDEMVERSSASRRVELFHLLLGLLHSPSPVAMTSRPSYFVDRGELDALLTTLGAVSRRREATVIGEQGSQEIRRLIVSRMKDDAPPIGPANETAHVVQVIRLLPLGSEHSSALVRRRAQDLEAIDTSPEAVIAFINRTYDLKDLATRPFLLKMIIESVLIGGLDIDDTTKQYGASDLYEIYTYAKLDLDLEKGQTRQEGLPLDSRRQLAETLAMMMYRANSLGLNFRDSLNEILSTPGDLRASLEESGLSEEEVATDFATCSFITLEDDGICRFVHKSFRGFFVARVLKAHLEPVHSFFADRIEREVLYFLGGFSATDPQVSELLWSGYTQAPRDAHVVRRNLLIAYLFTKISHRDRSLSHAEIDDVEFDHLSFSSSRINDVTWCDCVISDLSVDTCHWDSVTVTRAHIGRLVTRDSTFRNEMTDSVIEALDISRSVCALTLTGCAIRSCALSSIESEMIVSRCRVGRVQLNNSQLTYTARSDDGSLPRELELIDSSLRLEAGCRSSVEAKRSVIQCRGAYDGVAHWNLTNSILAFFSNSDRRLGETFPIGSVAQVDKRSLVVAGGPVSQSLLSVFRCGVFAGEVVGEWDWDLRPAAWGVLRAGPTAQALLLPEDAHGFRYGKVLLARDEWYDAEVAPGGALQSVLDLQNFVTDVHGLADLSGVGIEVRQMIRRVSEQYQALSRTGWPAVRQRQSHGSR